MRRDVAVYNEATGFSIHSANFCGVSRNYVLQNLYESVRNGIIIPINLVQDSSPHIRVITGSLTLKEEGEWVDRFAWKLRIPCGQLILEGGLDPRGPNADFMKSLEVPAGDYLVELYTLYWGINGFDCLPENLQEPPGAWFRRTRPNQRFPASMKFYLGENADEDPGHEDEWDEFYNSEKYEELEEPDWVDFILRLSPWKAGKEIELPCDQNGWFPNGLNPRKPELCPLGLMFRR